MLMNLLNVRSSHQLVYSNLAGDIRISGDTVRRWIDTLRSLHLGFLIKPWFKNISRSLRKEPKWLLRDWAGIEDAGDKGTQAWWDCMTGFLYCQYMEGKTNPQAKKAALRMIANWKAVLPELGGDPFNRRIKMFERALSR